MYPRYLTGVLDMTVTAESSLMLLPSQSSPSSPGPESASSKLLY